MMSIACLTGHIVAIWSIYCALLRLSVYCSLSGFLRLIGACDVGVT
jgi:hypothetical protein